MCHQKNIIVAMHYDELIDKHRDRFWSLFIHFLYFCLKFDILNLSSGGIYRQNKDEME